TAPRLPRWIRSTQRSSQAILSSEPQLANRTPSNARRRPRLTRQPRPAASVRPAGTLALIHERRDHVIANHDRAALAVWLGVARDRLRTFRAPASRVARPGNGRSRHADRGSLPPR